MPIAFGDELNSSIDHDEVLDPRRRADRTMVPRGQAPAAGVKKSSAAERDHAAHRVLENMAYRIDATRIAATTSAAKVIIARLRLRRICPSRPASMRQ
jgi:hypothetical protein